MNSEAAPAVVVGIDGSPAALDAALWAIDEAEHRGVPVHLMYVIESSDPDAQASRMACAQTAVKNVAGAIESTGRHVGIEISIVHGHPVETLLRASRSALMLCVGARGLRHSTRGRIGSTAAALSAAAQCPVAVVRSHRVHGRQRRSVVVELLTVPRRACCSTEHWRKRNGAMPPCGSSHRQPAQRTSRRNGNVASPNRGADTHNSTSAR